MTSKPKSTIKELLVTMLESHEMELTPIHTPISEYESVVCATKQIEDRIAEAYKDGYVDCHIVQRNLIGGSDE